MIIYQVVVGMINIILGIILIKSPMLFHKLSFKLDWNQRIFYKNEEEFTKAMASNPSALYTKIAGWIILVVGFIVLTLGILNLPLSNFIKRYPPGMS